MRLNLSISFVLALLLAFPSFAIALEENLKIGELFKNAHSKGTFVLYDVTEKKFIGFNTVRAEMRYIPASTFKIANSLIGLSFGIVKNVDEPLPYKGPAKPMIPAWGHDMDLRKAIAISNVPIYQELARRIGLERMHKGLIDLNYGNKEVGHVVDRFWLDGPLKISAIEQVQFLTKLVQNNLPIPQKVQEDVREILLLEEGSSWKLYGKTGWQNAPDQGIGWLVGWVEKKGRFYVFAMNIDIQKPADAAKRMELSKESLQLLGLIDRVQISKR